MGKGWIKLHRQLLDNPISKKPAWSWLWVVLLLKVNHENKKTIWNGKDTEIKSGQFITGRKILSEETGIPETTIERILKYLENGHQIGQQKYNKYRLITILKWKEYQSVDIKSDNKRTTNGHKQEVKELKEETAKAVNDMDIDYDTGLEIPEKGKSHKRDDVIKLALMFDTMASEYAKRKIITPKSYFIVINAINKHGLKVKGIEKLYEDWFNNEKIKDEDKVNLSFALSAGNINAFKVKN